jgi:hypothetical protein
MDKMVAYCGIVCSDYPVLAATQKDDDSERQQVAEMFTRQYGKEYKRKGHQCDGCLSSGPRIFSHCNVCGMRKCARENVENCAFCYEYPCDKLSELFAAHPKAKGTLDEIKCQQRIT